MTRVRPLPAVLRNAIRLAVPWAVPWGIASLLTVFAAYGLWSLPELIAFWGVPLAAVPMLAGWLALVAIPLVLARRGQRSAAIVVAAIGAVGVRIALGMLADGRLWPGDANIYLTLTEGLLADHRLALVEPYMGVETRALFPPLYPALLATWSLVAGLSTVSLVALGLAIDTATAWLIIVLARLLGRPRSGAVAAWLYVMWPSVLLSAPLAQKEGLCALLTLLLALQWVRYARAAEPGVRAAATIGALAGLLALNQPGELPLAALFGIVALGAGVRRLALMLVAGPIAAAVVMAPWWVRNAELFHTFVPLTSAGGYGLWIGNNPDTTGHWMPPPRRLYGLPELAFGKAAGRIAVAWIEANPVGFVRVTVMKAVRGWGIAEAGAMRFRLMQPPIAAAVSAGMFVTAQLAHFALLAAAIMGTRRRPPRAGSAQGTRILLLLVLACLAQTLCFGVFFEFGERHREFATPFLLLLGVWGLREGAADIAADGPIETR